MTASTVATQKMIDNTPTPEHEQNLNELKRELLNPIRIGWEEYCKSKGIQDYRIRITSGYRSKKLNDVIGGSQTSVHSIGYAADTIPYNGKMKDYRLFIHEFLKDKIFDQCIFEKVNSEGTPEWIHLGWKNNNRQQRKQFLNYDGKKYTIIN